MRNFTRFVSLFMGIFLTFMHVQAQNVLDPNDPIVTYNPASPPVEPPYGQIGKWVRTERQIWNTSAWKAYIYKGVAFRLLYPKTYNPTANDGKKYPMMIFWHGLGESSTIYDNEFHLLHGGDMMRWAVADGKFDGYIIAMQTLTANGSFFSPGHYQFMTEIIDYMVANNKLDPFRITGNGLSAGGTAAWDMLLSYPQYTSGIAPMSSTNIGLANSTVIEKIKFTPVWNVHGGLDDNPTPSTAETVKNAFLAAGANYHDLLYPDLGHGTWNQFWTEPDFWPFMSRAYSSNPWALGGRTEFCPGETINVTIGVSQGFDEYQWRKNGIAYGGNTNTIVATELATYTARVRRGAVWSDWSRIPLELKLKATTISPDIQASGFVSRVLPSLDGNTTIQLEVPAGYTSYEWQREGNPAVLGTSRLLLVSTPGDYKVKVSEQFSCSSQFSSLFRVVDANGPNKPDPAVNLIANTVSNSSIRLDWSDNPAPVNNETNFEIYQATQAGGPYTFIALTAADVRNYTVNGLNSNTSYFYKVRAVNNTGAAPASNEATALTQSDLINPTAPVVSVADIFSTSVALSWTPSTDDAGVAKYEIYVNGVLSYITTQTQFTVAGLVTGTTYNFYVKAKDLSGNASPSSNQVSATPSYGLDYKYYTFTGNWSVLPDFNTLSPVKTGKVQNVLLTPKTQNDQFAFLWEGYIRIPVAGSYYFRLNSDDGSKMYLGPLNGTSSPYNHAATAVVNNDGIHGPIENTSGILYLSAGVYPIAVTFFEQGGGENINLTWKTPLTGGNFVPVPNIAFTIQPAGAAPAKPSSLTATAVNYKRIDLSWSDNSNNETAFEIYRSTKPFSNFTTIARVGAGVTTYQDEEVNPSTKYYYRVKAINNFGESDFDLPGQGVDYSYYQEPGLSVLPDFNTLTPIKSGRQNNISIGMQDVPDNFQVKYSTTINIPADGIYTFYLKSDEGSKLYIDGFDDAHLVINHDGWHGPIEKSAFRNLSKGPHTFYVTYFEAWGGEELSVRISAAGLAKQIIPDEMLGTPLASATTPAAGIAPTKPTTLVANGTTTSSIMLTWSDNSSNETGFEIYRSASNNSNYILYTTVPANTNTFTDEGLFTNAHYYYKVRALGAVNSSGFSNEANARTQNIVPVITDVPNRTARQGTTTVIHVSATDADGDFLSFYAQNLPPFASLADNGNKTATLTLTNPSSGVYNNLIIGVNDTHGGSDVTQFNLTVNNNFDPVIAPIGNYTVTEGDNLSIALSATDADAGDLISWSALTLPSGYSITPGANGAATLNILPDAAASGTYLVQVAARDNNGGMGTRYFTLTVNDIAPAAPSALSGQYLFGQGVVLNWQDPGTNETGFTIYRSTTANGSFTPVGTVNLPNATTFTDNTVAANTQYYYKVKATNAIDASVYSNVADVFTDRMPVISPITNVLLKTNQNQTVNITVADDPGDVISLSATGLPSFASLINNGNGTGVINIQPNAGSLGVYEVVVTARDNHGSTSSTNFIIRIVDKDVSSVYINFTDNTLLAGAPWNNVQSSHFAGTVLNNLLDDSNINSGITVTMQDGWGWLSQTGMRSRTGNEVYPEQVSRGSLLEPSASTRRIVVGNLSAGKKYNFVFFTSFDQDRDIINSFTINGTTVLLNAKHNFNKTVQINGVSPDINGKINIDINKNGADYILLNSMVIQSYPNTLVTISPADLRITKTTRTSVSLQWQDRSSETALGGFEIWRAVNNGNFVWLANVGQNVTSYTDNNLTPNTTYHYAVKTKQDGTANYSEFSNVKSVTTYATSIYVNFNNAFPAPSPWNNLNTVPQPGYVWNNFMDSEGAPTSMGMVNTGIWSGLYGAGISTGNNSGVYPDNVMIESYGLFPGLSATVKITGLNVSMKYDLTFFASSNDYGDVTVAWTAGNTTSLMNVSRNLNGTVTLHDVVADENGELIITVAPGTTSSKFGLIGALVINGYNPGAASGPLPSSSVQNQQWVEVITDVDLKEESTRVYPNPFDSYFNLSVTARANETLSVLLYDLSGKLVFQKQVKNLTEGLNQVRVEPGRSLAPGTYLLKLQGSRSREFSLIKMIKK